MLEAGRFQNDVDRAGFGVAMKAPVSDETGRILFLRRPPMANHFSVAWEQPGGKVDAGEVFDAALVREFLEETGLTIGLDRVAGATQYDMPKLRLVVLFLEARAVTGEVRLSEEHDAYRSVALDEITKLELNSKLKEFVERCAVSAGR